MADIAIKFTVVQTAEKFDSVALDSTASVATAKECILHRHVDTTQTAALQKTHPDLLSAHTLTCAMHCTGIGNYASQVVVKMRRDGTTATAQGYDLQRILHDGGVDLYMAGHEHVFQHHRTQPPAYVVACVWSLCVAGGNTLHLTHGGKQE